MKIELDDYELKMRLGGLSEEEFQEFKKDILPNLSEYMEKAVAVFDKDIYEHDEYCDSIPYIVYRKDNLFLMNIDFDETGITFNSCPVKVFDRWANSRHIEFVIYYSWFDKEDVWKKGICKNIRKVERLCKIIPQKYWNCGMMVEL